MHSIPAVNPVAGGIMSVPMAVHHNHRLPLLHRLHSGTEHRRWWHHPHHHLLLNHLVHLSVCAGVTELKALPYDGIIITTYC